MPPEFIVNDARDRKTKKFAEVISKIGEKLASGSVRIKGVEVQPPTTTHCVLRYERTPHGSFKLKIELEWDERGTREHADEDLVS